MRKTVMAFGAAAVAVLLYVGASWYVGKEAEKVVAHAVTQANDRLARWANSGAIDVALRLEIREYRRGVFASHAQYVLHALDPEGKPAQYLIRDHLQHGPFPLDRVLAAQVRPLLATSSARLEPTPALQQWFDASQAAPLEVETSIQFGGKATSEWTFSSAQFQHGAKNIDFSGGSVQVRLFNDFNDSAAQGHFESYRMADSAHGESLTVRNIALESRSGVQDDGRIEQEGGLAIGSMTWVDATASAPLVVEDLRLSAQGRQSGQLLDASLRHDFTRVMLGEAEFGRLTLAAFIQQLDLSALDALRSRYMAMAQQRGPDVTPGFELTSDEQDEILAGMRALLAAEPAAGIEELVWANAAGESLASAALFLRDPGDIRDQTLDELLLQTVSQARMDVSIRRAMVVEFFRQAGANEEGGSDLAAELGGELFDRYAELLVQTGLMRLEDDTLSLSLRFASPDKHVVLNGQPIPIEQLMLLGLGLLLLQ